MNLLGHWVRGVVEQVVASTVIKTALASALAWWLAGWLVGPSKPYMAVLAVILSINVTIAETLSRGLQRILGVLGGIVIAFVVAAVWGMNAWTVGLLVLLGLGLGRTFRVGVLGTPQIAISGLVVWSMGHHRELSYAMLRFVDTMVGASVAVLVNGLLRPSDLSQRATQVAIDLVDDLKTSVNEIGQTLLVPKNTVPSNLREHARESDKKMAACNQAVVSADESLRWNLWAGQSRSKVRQLREVARLLENTHTQVRAMARIVADLDEAGSLPSQPELAQVMADAATALNDLRAWLQGDASALESEAVAATAQSLDRYWKKSAGNDVKPYQTQLWAVALTAERLIGDRRQLGAPTQDP